LPPLPCYGGPLSAHDGLLVFRARLQRSTQSGNTELGHLVFKFIYSDI
jgi:hypothetical protein